MVPLHAPASADNPGTPAGPSGVGPWAWLTSPQGELVSSLVAGTLLLAGFLAGLAGAEGLRAGLYWASLGIGMVHGLRAAAESIRERAFDIDVLMAVGAALAAYVGAPAEGALLLFLFVLSGALEALATARTTRAVEALHRLMPSVAHRLAADGQTFEEVAPGDLRPGDLVRVPPGETIPADGAIAEGESAVDQATLTGESRPRSIRPGDEVFAGTINVGNPVRVRVSRPSGESSLQRILDLVLEAQRQREPVQRLIDRLNQPYAMGVMGASAAVFLGWWLGFGVPATDALYTAITLLIVASPCAVIIATPTATLAAIARGARAGVLFKGGQSLERLARLRAVAFDKTGTLTVGRMRVREVHPIGWSDATRLLAVAAGLEQDSTHPIARAIVRAAEEAGVAPATVRDPTFTPGRGVGGFVDGAEARLGSLVHASDAVPVCLRARVAQVLGGVQSRGDIGTVVAHDGQAGVVILSDTARPGADRLVRDLHALGVRPVVMLTGDNRATAKAVADALGLDRFEAELLPGGKVDAVAALKAEARAADPRAGVGVIGDGVNDAPALTAADVSIAIGSIGSDAALESADIVLLADDLGVVPWAVGLARRTRRTILFNLSFALAAILLMAATTLVGSRLGFRMPLWMGVLGHEGGTLLVVFNSLLLLLHPGGGAERNDDEDRSAPLRVVDEPAAQPIPAGRS